MFHSLSPKSLLRSMSIHRQLIVHLIRRDIAGRYKGSAGGILWALLTPLVMLAIYLFVFGLIFNPRRGTPTTNLFDFGLSLFCGVVVFGLFSECLTRAPTVVVGQPSYVKKVVFPLEILALIQVGSAFFHFLIGIGVLILVLILVQALPATALLLPVVIAPLLLFCAGVVWLFSALAVFLRDIGQITGLLATVLMFLSPIFYSSSALPEKFRPLMLWNPLTVPIEMSREVLLAGHWPDWNILGIYALISAVIAWFGFAFFQKVRKGFADVL